MGPSWKWSLVLTVLMASMISYCSAIDPVRLVRTTDSERVPFITFLYTRIWLNLVSSQRVQSGCVSVTVQDWTRPLCREFDFIYINANPKNSKFEFTVLSGFHSGNQIGVEPKTAQPEFVLGYSLPLSVITKAGYPLLIIGEDSCLYTDSQWSHLPSPFHQRKRRFKTPHVLITYTCSWRRKENMPANTWYNNAQVIQIVQLVFALRQDTTGPRCQTRITRLYNLKPQRSLLLMALMIST